MRRNTNREKINAKFVSFIFLKNVVVSHLACHSCNFLQRFETRVFQKNEEGEGEEGRKRTNRGVLRKINFAARKMHTLHFTSRRPAWRENSGDVDQHADGGLSEC